MQPSRTLVLGASGQLGAELCRQLGQAALPAARKPQEPDWLQLDLEALAADATALPALLAKHNVSTVICAAGATDVERCESDHAWADAANHTGPLALARASRDITFVFYSTDYVFDGQGALPGDPGTPAGPYLESATPNPLSVYGRTKLAGEQSILDAHPQALVLRTTTVYGPDPQRKNFLYTLRRLLTEGKTMRVPSDQYANPTYNADLASATLALLHSGSSGVVHVAGPEYLPRTAFAYKACRLLSLDSSLIQPVTTAELQQKAARPLLGGLRSERLDSLAPGLMRTPDQGIRDWATSLGILSEGAGAAQ